MLSRENAEQIVTEIIMSNHDIDGGPAQSISDLAESVAEGLFNQKYIRSRFDCGEAEDIITDEISENFSGEIEELSEGIITILESEAIISYF